MLQLRAVDLKTIKTSYSAAAGTALVTFEDAIVPANYVMGKENEGLKASAKTNVQREEA